MIYAGDVDTRALKLDLASFIEPACEQPSRVMSSGGGYWFYNRLGIISAASQMA